MGLVLGIRAEEGEPAKPTGVDPLLLVVEQASAERPLRPLVEQDTSLLPRQAPGEPFPLRLGEGCQVVSRRRMGAALGIRCGSGLHLSFLLACGRRSIAAPRSCVAAYFLLACWMSPGTPAASGRPAVVRASAQSQRGDVGNGSPTSSRVMRCRSVALPYSSSSSSPSSTNRLGQFTTTPSAKISPRSGLAGPAAIGGDTR